MRLPGTDSLQRTKLILEVLLLVILIPVVLYTLAFDRAAAIKLAKTA